VIARIWHGAVPAAKADEYLRLMHDVAIPDYRSVPGNAGAYALRRFEGGVAHFFMLTFWDSMQAISRFAGHDVEAAKYYAFDRDFLIELEPTVKHYEVVD
jgi:heme-degrading monooxygenase HmoA